MSINKIKNGYDFEQYVANLYDKLGYTTKVTQKSGDQGGVASLAVYKADLSMTNISLNLFYKNYYTNEEKCGKIEK